VRRTIIRLQESEYLEYLSHRAVMEDDRSAAQQIQAYFREDREQGYFINDGLAGIYIPPARYLQPPRQGPENEESSLRHQDLIRKVIPYLKQELESEDLGTFRENLKVLSTNLQIKIIQYLIQKFSEKEFTRNLKLDLIIKNLDEDQMLGSLELAIKTIMRTSTVWLSNSQRAMINAALVESLNKIEMEFSLRIKLNKKFVASKARLKTEENASQMVHYLLQKYASRGFQGEVNLDSQVAEKQIFQWLDQTLGQFVHKMKSKRIETDIVKAALTEALNELMAFSPSNRFAFLMKGISFFNQTEVQKMVFLENLRNYLSAHQEQHDREDLLDLFRELRNRQGQFAFIHDQKNPKRDWFCLLFKPKRNSSGEAHFWHTTTYKNAIELLIETYLLLNDNLHLTRAEEERCLLNYFQNNSLSYSKHPSRRVCS